MHTCYYYTPFINYILYFAHIIVMFNDRVYQIACFF